MQDFSQDRYGKLPMHQSQERKGIKENGITIHNRDERLIFSVGIKYESIKDINGSRVGEDVTIRARVHTSRATGNKMCFFVFRQGVSTIQGIISADDKTISKPMIKFCIGIPAESIVLVEGKISKPVEEVKSCTISDAELSISKIYIQSEAEGRLVFSLEDASRPETDFEQDPALVRVNLDTRLNNRVLDLRTTTNNAIFRLQSAVCLLFREYLLKKEFMEIHTPKMIAAASEGGSNVFKISYFKRDAFLAQSPQLYKQMCIAADFDRVFEIGPVFRAEDSNTHRHMTEFVGLDMEMAIQEHYHEVVDVLDEMFVYIFTNLKKRYNNEIETVKRQYPFADFEFLPKTLRLKYADAIQLLREAGVEIGDYEDLR